MVCGAEDSIVHSGPKYEGHGEMPPEFVKGV